MHITSLFRQKIEENKYPNCVYFLSNELNQSLGNSRNNLFSYLVVRDQIFCIYILQYLINDYKEFKA